MNSKNCSGWSLLEVRERAAIEGFLRADLDLHLYELGDLDPFFWPRTRWLGVAAAPSAGAALLALALIYADPAGHQTLLLLERRAPEAAAWLLARAAALLPERFYAHLSPGLAAQVPRRGLARGSYLKWSLQDAAALPSEPEQVGVERLGPDAREEVEAFYAAAYPGNWFEATMLETGCYRGWREAGRLVCVAGVHVYAPGVKAAALGNVATHPDARGRGLARRVTGALCAELHGAGLAVGLNVAAENAAAIACYERLGFRRVAEYEEWQFEPRSEGS